MENLKDILRVQGIKAKGFGIIPKLVMQDSRLTRDAKAIYAYFCSFAGSGEIAFPSVKKICKDLGFKSEDTYRKHFKLLVLYNYIKVQQQKGEGGKFAGNIYTLIDKPDSTDTENLGDGKKEDLTDTQFFRDGKKPGTVNWGTNNNNINKNNSINNINNIKSVSPSDAVPTPREKPREIKKTDRQTDDNNSVETIINELIEKYGAEVVKRALAKIRGIEEKTGNAVGKKGFKKYLEKVCEEQDEIVKTTNSKHLEYSNNNNSFRRIGKNVYEVKRDLNYLVE